MDRALLLKDKALLWKYRALLRDIPEISRVLGLFYCIYTAFWWKSRVLCGNIGPFCGNTGLFCGDLGLFCGIYLKYQEFEGSLVKIRGSFVEI